MPIRIPFVLKIITISFIETLIDFIDYFRGEKMTCTLWTIHCMKTFLLRNFSAEPIFPMNSVAKYVTLLTDLLIKTTGGKKFSIILPLKAIYLLSAKQNQLLF